MVLCGFAENHSGLLIHSFPANLGCFRKIRVIYLNFSSAIFTIGNVIVLNVKGFLVCTVLTSTFLTWPSRPLQAWSTLPSFQRCRFLSVSTMRTRSSGSTLASFLVHLLRYCSDRRYCFLHRDPSCRNTSCFFFPFCCEIFGITWFCMEVNRPSFESSASQQHGWCEGFVVTGFSFS